MMSGLRTTLKWLLHVGPRTVECIVNSFVLSLEKFWIWPHRESLPETEKKKITINPNVKSDLVLTFSCSFRGESKIVINSPFCSSSPIYNQRTVLHREISKFRKVFKGFKNDFFFLAFKEDLIKSMFIKLPTCRHSDYDQISCRPLHVGKNFHNLCEVHNLSFLLNYVPQEK